MDRAALLLPGRHRVIVSGIMLKKTKLFAGRPTPFVMELPSYHMPSARSWALHVWERVSAYVKKAFTIIFASTIVVWFLSNFGLFNGVFGYLPLWRASRRSSPTTLCWRLSPACSRGSSRRLASILGRQRPCPSRAWSPRRTSWPPRRRFCTWQMLPRPTQLWAAFAALFPSAGAIARLRRLQPVVRPVLRCHGHHSRSDELCQVDRRRAGLRVRFRLGRGLMINQFYLAAQGVFSIWTVIAVLFALAILFQLFRPMPRGAWTMIRRSALPRREPLHSAVPL